MLPVDTVGHLLGQKDTAGEGNSVEGIEAETG